MTLKPHHITSRLTASLIFDQFEFCSLETISLFSLLSLVDDLLADNCCFCLGIAPSGQLLKKSAFLLQLVGNGAPLVAHDGSEVARAKI